MSKIHHHLRQLVEALPERQAVLAVRLLEALLEDAEASDTEPLSASDLEDVREAQARVERGEFIRWEDLKKELQEQDEGES